MEVSYDLKLSKRGAWGVSLATRSFWKYKNLLQCSTLCYILLNTFHFHWFSVISCVMSAVFCSRQSFWWKIYISPLRFWKKFSNQFIYMILFVYVCIQNDLGKKNYGKKWFRYPTRPKCDRKYFYYIKLVKNHFFAITPPHCI